MAERLTKFNKTGWVLKLDEPQNEFEARQQLMSKFKLACEKLGKIEDMLEKYGIESAEELEKELDDFTNFMKGNKFETIEDLQNALNGKFIEVFDEKNKIWQDMVKNLTKTEQDRDTWQKACELACREAPLHCPNPPEYYNAQDEYGSDEPYYIQESACEFSDDAERCLECQINYFYQQAKTEGIDE